MLLTADFETTITVDDCRIWAWGIAEIGNTKYFKWGKNLDEFMEFCAGDENHTIYFHNVKFDGTFIMVWLFEHGFKHVISKWDIDEKTFTTLISDKGQHYSIAVYFEKHGKKYNKVTFYDSLKKLPFKVSQIATGFNLPIMKGEIDYKKKRPLGYEPTDEEIDYLTNDVQIPAMALNTMFSQGMHKMTIGRDALEDYKDNVGKKNFDRWFPIPNYDKDIRESYKGGYTYLQPQYRGKEIKGGATYDVNSLYPSVMYYKPLPFGHGVQFTGQYEQDDIYPLYTQMLRCDFELKPGFLPTIQIKRQISKFIETEYLTSSNYNTPALCLTSVDLELFLKHYNVYNIEYLRGWKFKASTELFKAWIDKWIAIKIDASITGNESMRTLAKLVLNNLYGKFSTNPETRSKYPVYADGVIKYKYGEWELRDPVYIPVGTFVTSWARHTTITAGQLNYDRAVYFDTDSMHIAGDAPPIGIEVHDTKLGAWKHESDWQIAKFLRQKSYMEKLIITEKEFNKLTAKNAYGLSRDDNGFYHTKVTCAGMPETCYKHVTLENFNLRASYPGKLQHKNVKGGVILKEQPFTFKIGKGG